MQGKAFVAGVGMVPFGKPGASDPYDVMAAAAVRSSPGVSVVGPAAPQRAAAAPEESEDWYPSALQAAKIAAARIATRTRGRARGLNCI